MELPSKRWNSIVTFGMPSEPGVEFAGTDPDIEAPGRVESGSAR
jgi:hypothetical protein